MTDEETQQVEEWRRLDERANGKPITFVPRHWTLYEWVGEQPGDDLEDKLYRIVKAAYNADYARQGYEAQRRYWEALEEHGLTPLGLSKMCTALSEACESFDRAGMHEDGERARELLRAVMYQQLLKPWQPAAA